MPVVMVIGIMLVVMVIGYHAGCLVSISPLS